MSGCLDCDQLDTPWFDSESGLWVHTQKSGMIVTCEASMEAKHSMFMLVAKDGKEMLRIDEDGTFTVQGKKAKDAKDVVEAFKQFLIDTGHLQQMKGEGHININTTIPIENPDGNEDLEAAKEILHDGRKVLAKMSGMSEDAVESVWQEVKANYAKLDACESHVFKKTGEGLRASYVCENCSGSIRPGDHKWYAAGRKHGRNEKHKGDTAQGRISHLQGILCAVSSAFGMDGTHEKLKAEIDGVLAPDKYW